MELDSLRAMQAHQVLRQVALAVTAIVLAQSVLPSAEIGTYELLFYVGYTVTFFWSTGLVQGLLSFFSDFDARGKAELLFNSWFFFNLLTGALLLLLLVFKTPILLFLAGRPDIDYFFLFLVFLFFNIPGFLLEHFLLLLERPGRILLLGIAFSIAYILAVSIPVLSGWGLEYAVGGLIVVAAAKYSWLLALVIREGYWRWRLDQLKHWLRLSGPLIAYALLGGFILTFDNWLVNFHYQGDQSIFAIFRYGARELPLGQALAGAFATAVLPVVAADTGKGLQLIRERSRRLFHLLFPLSILLLLTSYWWFPLVFTQTFRQSILIFDIFLLIIISRVVFSRTILMGLRDNQTVLLFSLLEVIVNAGIAMLLIGPFGLAGVAAATVFAYTLEKALICVYLYRRYGIPPGKYIDLPVFLGYSTLLVGSLLIVILMNP